MSKLKVTLSFARAVVLQVCSPGQQPRITLKLVSHAGAGAPLKPPESDALPGGRGVHNLGSKKCWGWRSFTLEREVPKEQVVTDGRRFESTVRAKAGGARGRVSPFLFPLCQRSPSKRQEALIFHPEKPWDPGWNHLCHLRPCARVGCSGGVWVPNQVSVSPLQKCIRFNPDATVWVAKQRILCSLNQSLKDVLNYGLFQPASCGRDGKFLDEERLLREYPQPVGKGVPSLEVLGVAGGGTAPKAKCDLIQKSPQIKSSAWGLEVVPTSAMTCRRLCSF